MAAPALRSPRSRARTASPATAPTRAGFPWLQALVLGCVALLFAATLAEIGLRIVDLRASNLAGLQCLGSGTLLQGQKGLYVLDSSAGYDMRPNTCVRLKTREYDGVLRNKGPGLPGPEVAGAENGGGVRLVGLR